MFRRFRQDSHLHTCIDNNIKYTFNTKYYNITITIIYLQYNFLHVTPPMSAPDVIRSCTSLVDENGWLDVDMETMQSVHYPNVFGTGDNINVPTVKTAAAIRKLSAEMALYSTVQFMTHSHGLTQQGVWVSFWTPKPLKSTPQDTQYCL